MRAFIRVLITCFEIQYNYRSALDLSKSNFIGKTKNNFLKDLINSEELCTVVVVIFKNFEIRSSGRLSQMVENAYITLKT